MKKIGLLFREIAENRIKNSLKESSSLFIIKYSGLSSPDLTNLRQSLKNAGGTLFMVKNTVTRRALKTLKLDEVTNTIDGPCGLIFVKEEPVNAASVLYNFSREHAGIKLEAGLIEERVLNTKDIETLARIPSKEVLRAQLVMTLRSPIAGLVIALNQMLNKFIWCLEQIGNKKGETHA